MLTVATVAGLEFEITLLRSVCDLTVERALELLREASSWGIVVPVSTALGRFAFAHALTRETLYDAQPPDQRTELHRRIAETLEDLYAANLEPHLAEVAHHFVAAIAVGGAEKAFEYCRRAGGFAERLFAYEEAALHYGRALDLVQRVSADGRLRCQLLLARGRAAAKAGAEKMAREAFGEAAALAKRLGDPGILAQAALGFGSGVSGFGFYDKPDEALRLLLEDALRAQGEEDTILRVRLTARLAVALYYTGEAARRVSLSREAMETARRLGDPATRLTALVHGQFALMGPDGPASSERMAAAREILRLASEVGERGGAAFCAHHFSLLAALEAGDIRRADEAIAACRELASDLRRPVYLWLTCVFEAMRKLRAGRFEEGGQLALDALELGQRVNPEIATITAGAQTFLRSWGQGRLADLEPSIRAFTEQHHRSAWRAGLASLYGELGRREEARVEFESAAAAEFADLPRDWNWLFTVSELAAPCAFLGDTRRAAKLHEILSPYAGRGIVAGGGAVAVGCVSGALGLLAATMGRFEEANGHFEADASFNARSGNKPFLTLTLQRHAQMLATRGGSDDRERAVALYRRALSLARALDMGWLADAIETSRSELRSRRGWASMETSAVESRSPGNVPEVAFRREGRFWVIGARGRVFRLKDASGVGYLRELLRRPDEKLHVTELLAAAEPLEGAAYAGVAGAGDRVIDQRAKREYRCRLEELRAELGEAERLGDSRRAGAAEKEIEAVMHELAKAVGLGGRDRNTNSSVERARTRVTKALRTTLEKITEADPVLGHHLARSLRTGRFCSYEPGPAGSVAFVFSF